MYSFAKLAVLASIFAPAIAILFLRSASLLRRVAWSIACVGVGALCIVGSLLTPYISDTWMSGSLKIGLAVLGLVAGLTVPWLVLVLFRRKLANGHVA
jgi:hypothetical protein